MSLRKRFLQVWQVLSDYGLLALLVILLLVGGVTHRADAFASNNRQDTRLEASLLRIDERGKALSSRDLGEHLSDWQSAGRDLCFLIGGPDGVSDECAARADFRWSLSRMTLPHGLARVMFSEQLYRAWTLTQGHPYHRD